MSCADNFLSAAEKKVIQSNYETILDHMKVDELILKLHQDGFISPREKGNLKNKSDDEKAQYIIDEILFKTTYHGLCKIRNILIRSGDASHLMIARHLPTRGEFVDYELQHPSSIPVHLGGSSRFNDRRGSDPPTFPVQEATNRWSYGESESSQYLSSSFPYAESPVQAAGPPRFVKQLRNSFKKKASSKSTPNICSDISPLGSYEVKPNNNQVTGKALCVIIANFTDDLEGYEKDVACLVDLHKKVLKHEFVFEGEIPGSGESLKNLTKSELLSVLQKIASLLNPLSGIDRFFLYILSHGDEDGVMTCARGSAKYAEDTDPKTMKPLKDPKTGKPLKIRTQLQDIIDMFTHDKVPCLKGFPKVFINQWCKGSEILRAAAPSDEDTVDLHKPPPWQPPKAKVAIGADVLVCEATSDSNYAWVAEHGSLYIQCLVQVIEQYHETEHLYDILVEVNNRLAHKVKKGINPTDNKIVQASQMPSITSKLTKKLYLSKATHLEHYYH